MLNGNLTLSGLLLIPSFKFSLISVSKFTDGCHLLVHFTDSHCLIQDLAKKLLVSGEAVNGLYQILLYALKVTRFV